jgi:Cu+-exporting ATPase
LGAAGVDDTRAVLVWRVFFPGAWKALKRHAADMNTLIALGTVQRIYIRCFVTVFPESWG